MEVRYKFFYFSRDHVVKRSREFEVGAPNCKLSLKLPRKLPGFVAIGIAEVQI